MTRPAYFEVVHFPTSDDVWEHPEHWLVRFRGGNHRIVFNGQQWHSEEAALHAITLIDPGGVHPVKHRDRRT